MNGVRMAGGVGTRLIIWSSGGDHSWTIPLAVICAIIFGIAWLVRKNVFGAGDLFARILERVTGSGAQRDQQSAGQATDSSAEITGTNPQAPSVPAFDPSASPVASPAFAVPVPAAPQPTANEPLVPVALAPSPSGSRIPPVPLPPMPLPPVSLPVLVPAGASHGGDPVPAFGPPPLSGAVAQPSASPAVATQTVVEPVAASAAAAGPAAAVPAVMSDLPPIPAPFVFAQLLPPVPVPTSVVPVPSPPALPVLTSVPPLPPVPSSSALPVSTSVPPLPPVPSPPAHPAPTSVEPVPAPPILPQPPLPAPTAAPMVPPAPAAVSVGDDHDTHETRVVSAPAEWQVALADRRVLSVGSAMRFGRDPIVDPADPGVVLVPLPDPARSLSKTHAQIEARPGELLVTDLYSTNGTAVIVNGSPTVLAPGKTFTVTADAELHFGDYVMQVRRKVSAIH